MVTHSSILFQHTTANSLHLSYNLHTEGGGGVIVNLPGL